MDPNLFALQTDRLFEALIGIITLSFFVERALAVVFENRWFVQRFAHRGLKEPLTVLVAFAVCRYWDFDALSILFAREKTSILGHLLTATIVAGGSKGSIKLFHDVFNTMSTAERTQQQRAKAQLPPPRASSVPSPSVGTP
jgi:hypothetical protein